MCIQFFLYNYYLKVTSKGVKKNVVKDFICEIVPQDIYIYYI